MDGPLRIVDRANGDEPSATDEPREPHEPAIGRPGRRPSARSPRARLRRRPSLLGPTPLRAGRVARTRHRNPTWLVAGVLLVVLSALGGVLLFASNDDRIEVLVAAADLQPGVRVERTDLRIARVALDGGVATVDPGAATELIGRQAVGRVPAGTLLSSGMFADELPLAADEVVFGAALDPGEAPLSGLQVGTRVELVAVELGEPGRQDPPLDETLASTGGPAAADDADTTRDAAVTPIGVGTVWAVEPIATGQLWVSVRVDRDVGMDASLASALGALRIVLVGTAP